MSFATKLKELQIRQRQSLRRWLIRRNIETHIWDMEQGNSTNPSRELLVKLARHFRISVSELVGEDRTRRANRPSLSLSIET